MKYIDHYILAQGGIHNITAFAVAFNNFFLGLIYQRVWFQLRLLLLTHVVCFIHHRTEQFFRRHFRCQNFVLVFQCIRFDSRRSSRAAHGGQRRWPCLDFPGICISFE